MFMIAGVVYKAKLIMFQWLSVSIDFIGGISINLGVILYAKNKSSNTP